MLLQTVIGNENWPTGSTKFHMFVCPTALFPLDGQEAHLWQVSRRGAGPGRPTISGVGSPRIISAGNGLNAEIFGKWTTMVYDMPENVLIKVMLMRSVKDPPSNRSANVLLRTREAAGIRRIAVTTIRNPKSAMDRLIVEGKFDIIDLQQAAELGFSPPSAYMPTYLQSRWTNMPYLTITDITQDTAAAPRVVRQRVQNSTGATVEVTSTHRRRALDL